MKLKTRISALWCFFITTVITMVAVIRREPRHDSGGLPLPSTQRSVVGQRVRSQYRLYAGRPLPTDPPLIVDVEQTARQRHLANECNRTIISGTLNITSQSLYVDDQRRFVYCLLHGVAPSRWSRVLTHGSQRLRRARVSVKQLSSVLATRWRNDGLGPLLPLNKLYFTDSEIANRLSTYYKFIFVRHPIERLVATFLDRLHHINSPRQARVPPEVLSPRSNDVIDTRALDEGVEEATRRTKVFKDFVRYILSSSATSNGNLVDAFWRPQYELCQPCVVKYDFIGHYDTLNNDAYNVLETIGLKHVRFPESDKMSGISVTPRLLSRMMYGLSATEVRRLLEFYGLDLQLFNFTESKYVI